MGLETKNDCGDEEQQQFTGMDLSLVSSEKSPASKGVNTS
jgi:hypothetical protein